MTSTSLLHDYRASDTRSGSYDRLRQTRTLRDGAHDRYGRSRIGIIGVGNVGGRFASEAVRSGASVRLFDPDVGAAGNLGTQIVEEGVAKVDTVVQMCNRIAPGRAEGRKCNVLHAGISTFDDIDLLVDCSDDPNLAYPLTEISNGICEPLMRLAIDGSGQRELGRVLLSHGGGGHACQLCSYDERDLHRSLTRTSCLGEQAAGPPPTIAGGALGMAIAGLGVLQAQRLLGGNDTDLVWDHEIILDLTGFQMLVVQHRRSANCLSQHTPWELTRLTITAQETSLCDLFAIARDQLRSNHVTLEPYGHPVCLAAVCPCGALQQATGSVWAGTPPCDECGGATAWRRDVKLRRVNEAQARELGIYTRPLTHLGMPDKGLMVVAAAPQRVAVRLVLN